MVKINFARDAAALLRQSSVLLVVAPQSRCTPAKLRSALGRELGQLAATLAGRTKPGDLGKVASTLTGAAHPEELLVAVLPDGTSRHNGPARPESIRRAVTTIANREGRCAILLLLDDPDHCLAAYNAVAKALPTYSAKTGPRQRSEVRVLACGGDAEPLPAKAAIQATVAATREAARLFDTPPTELDPARLAVEAKRLLRGLPSVEVTEIRGEALIRRRLGGIHAVGRCAESAPRMLIARTGGQRRGLHVALVGKGITYDTGGLHLKARGGMEGMKGDMGGAAAVLGAFTTLVRSRCPHRLTLVLCMAENAIGPRAYKPDDIITMHSGKTVEINNTDAEGRLLLADGVSYAARVLKADVVVDAATLTGAQLVSTGALHAAVVSNDDDLEATFVAAGRRSGDLCHPLLFCPEFFKLEFESPVADMRNSVKNRSNAQTSCAAQFVFWHLEGTDVRWVHVDLAGPVASQDRGTGYGVALLAEAVRGIR